MRFNLHLCLAMVCPAAVAAPGTPSLCLASEKIAFTCSIKGKILSVCTSAQLTGSSGTVQYRFGTPAKLELEYPAAPRSPKGVFWSSVAMYSGGGEFRIRFKNGAAEYLIFDSSIRTGFGPEGNQTEFSSGVITKLRGKVTSTRSCGKPAFVDSDVLGNFPQEEFDYDARP